MSNSNVQNVSPIIDRCSEDFFLKNVPKHFSALRMRRKIRDALSMGTIFFFEPDQSLLDI